MADSPHSGDDEAPVSRPDETTPRPDAPHGEPPDVARDARRYPLSVLDVAAPVPKVLRPPPASTPAASPAHTDPEEPTMPEKSEFYPADNPAATKHIDVLQGIINRLANNSASCKTWCLTLTGALLSLAGATKVPELVFLAIAPLVVFRYLDSRYLAQERAYRGKYNAIIKLIQDGNYKREHVFSAGAAWTPADLQEALRSWSVRPLYCTLIGLYGLYVIGYLAVWYLACLNDWHSGWFGYFNPPPPPRLPQAMI
jgi:hypothetical protein